MTSPLLFVFVGEIHDIIVDFPPVIEVNQQSVLYIYLTDIYNNTYNGVVNISIKSDLQSNMLLFSNSPIKINLTYNVGGMYKNKVTASNHVSDISKDFTVDVVRKSIYP